MFHINHYGELTGGSLELDAIRARLEKLRQKSFDQKKPWTGPPCRPSLDIDIEYPFQALRPSRRGASYPSVRYGLGGIKPLNSAARLLAYGGKRLFPTSLPK